MVAMLVAVAVTWILVGVMKAWRSPGVRQLCDPHTGVLPVAQNTTTLVPAGTS
jgi:hypothetical protein